MPTTINIAHLRVTEPIPGQPVVGIVECQAISSETGQAGPWVSIPVRFAANQDPSRRDTVEWAFTRARAKMQARIDGRVAGTNTKPIDVPADGEQE